MHRIVVLSNRAHEDDKLMELLHSLFPECEIFISSVELDARDELGRDLRPRPGTTFVNPEVYYV